MSDLLGYKQPTIARTRVLWDEVEPAVREILGGNMLVVDPSIGTAHVKGGSLPGYAIFEAGVLKESGVIEVPVGRTKTQHERLFELGRTLRDDFSQTWDVLVLERVPAMRMGKFNSAKAQVPLHMACGAILSSTVASKIVNVQPKQWQEVCPDNYVKSDANDAICMGVCVLQYAKYMSILATVAPRNARGRALAVKRKATGRL